MIGQQKKSISINACLYSYAVAKSIIRENTENQYLCVMPIFKEWQQGNHARGAIWKIEEPEDFFSSQTGLQSDKKSELRRLEHLAGRFLLSRVAPGLELNKIEISHLGKPFLPGKELHFSISHSFPFIGVAIDTEKEIGIDVQTLQEKILRLQHKFLSLEEQMICGNRTDKITLAWAAKEAAFKRYGLGAVDFIKHMPIREMLVRDDGAALVMEFMKEDHMTTVNLSGGIEQDFAWSVTI